MLAFSEGKEDGHTEDCVFFSCTTKTKEAHLSVQNLFHVVTLIKEGWSGGREGGSRVVEKECWDETHADCRVKSDA